MSEAQNGGNVMERLTNNAWRNFDPWECCGQDKYCQRGCHDPGGCTNGCVVPQLYAHLGAYEYTGLAPEEVSTLVKDWSDLRTIIGECGGIDRVRALAEADKAGRLVVRPCKVGDTLFRVFAGEILEHKVSNMRYLAIQGRWDIDTTPFCSYVESSIGKTIFLTREEAKAALEEMKDE